MKQLKIYFIALLPLLALIYIISIISCGIRGFTAIDYHYAVKPELTKLRGILKW